MTHRVPPTAQGELQGALNSVRGIGMLVAPSLFTLTLAYFIGPGIGWHVPGAPWLLAAVLLLAALALAWRYAHPLPATQDETPPVPVEEPEPSVV